MEYTLRVPFLLRQYHFVSSPLCYLIQLHRHTPSDGVHITSTLLITPVPFCVQSYCLPHARNILRHLPLYSYILTQRIRWHIQ
jgi:hypothetical protein